MTAGLTSEGRAMPPPGDFDDGAAVAFLLALCAALAVTWTGGVLMWRARSREGLRWAAATSVVGLAALAIELGVAISAR